MSYSVELGADETGEPGRPFGAYLLFLRWRRVGEQGVEGHLESDFLAWGHTATDALEDLGRMRLSEVHATLEQLIRGDDLDRGGHRRWWDVMRDETSE